jgi:zinc and cadmium transporter
MEQPATFAHIVFFSLIGGVFSLLGGVLLLSKKSYTDKLSLYATPFAAGALLAAVFLDLLPEGVHESSSDLVFVAALVGLVVFFIIERTTDWFHHHHDEADQKRKNVGLIILGDTLHNALDGIAIASAFLINVPTGIVTTIAVAAHEIPQEIGDFGLLLARGMRRKHVLLVNLGSAIATLVAALITFSVGSSSKLPVGTLLGLSAGFLLYIAASDLIPSIHSHTKPKRAIDPSILLLILGIVVVGIAIKLAGKFIAS